ncbi:MAG: carboxypeptidase regulatory-like domain-containing protein [Candidatus Neomarinimicrobiota bacterium]
MKQPAKNFILIVFATALVGSFLVAQDETYTVSGVVKDQEGEKVPAADVVLLDADGGEVDQTSTGKRFGGKGKFEFKKVSPGRYSVKATEEDAGSASLDFAVADEDQEIELSLVVAKKPGETGAAAAGKEAERLPQEEYVTTELSFELKKLAAEMDHLGGQVRDLQARSEMWTNPLSIYSKEIILDNGSTVFGKVVYQDEEILKVETLVGYLVIDRSQVVRIVENVIAEEEPEYIPEQIRETYSPPPMPKLAQPRYVAGEPTERLAARDRAANIVLMGNISEKRDRSNNTTFSGQVKNIGGRRSDFVKVNFVFRKNWSGETQTLTSFVSGSYYSFDSGITTDSSLLPGATGTFELVIPAEFGSYIGYSYTIDWEEYE